MRDYSTFYTLDGFKNVRYVSDATRYECKDTIPSSQIHVVHVVEDVVTSIKVVFKDKVYATVTAAERIPINPAHVRVALQESLRIAHLVAVSSYNYDSYCLVAMVDGTVVTIEDGAAYRASI
ncbi:hypothetical protein BG015_001245 [Linnemannia schmuckeri]|uniref:Uncharacterized protein n=1 Tax=Linnemannia schmuckeri TaxID=64567 RepID=A0A9P5S3P6_9FUNG|nr:hypothetical protein BG015_001245 [Linnemannia schmuckeri]